LEEVTSTHILDNKGSATCPIDYFDVHVESPIIFCILVHLPVYKNASKNDYRMDVFELQNRVPQSIASLYPTTPIINELDQTKAKRNPVNTDHGAHENFMNIKALGTSFSVPAKVCAGATVKGDIKVRNMFVDTIYNFNVTMATDQGARVTQSVTNKILSGDSLNISFNPSTQSYR
jgi:hypothetical protein